MSPQHLWPVFFLLLSSLPGESLTVEPASLTESSSPGVLRWEPGLHAAEEGNGPFVIRIERLEGHQGEVSVHYTLRSNVARMGEDFLPFSGTVTFAGGESHPKSLVIPVLDDTLPERDEPLLLTLSDPSGGALLAAPVRAVFEIRDDDSPSPLLAEAPFDIAESGYYTWEEVSNPKVAVLPGGGFIVSWSIRSDKNQALPYLGSALYNAARQRIAGSLWLSSGAFGLRLAAHPSGAFTMAGGAYNSSFLGNFGQRFDPKGQALGPPFNLPSDTWGIAAGRGGSLFALVDSLDGSCCTVSLLRLGKSGQILDSPQVVGPSGGWYALASDELGHAIVAWTEGPQGLRRLFVRRMGADGQWHREARLADPLLERQPGRVVLAASPDGRFVVVWEGSSDSHGTGIFGRRFAASGEPLGPVFQVNSQPAGDQSSPQVALQGDGRFLVVWESPAENRMQHLHGQYFAADGSRLGSEMIVADGRDPERQRLEAEPALGSDAAGHYVIVWRRAGEQPQNITCRRFKAPDR